MKDSENRSPLGTKEKFDSEFLKASRLLYNLGRRFFGKNEDDILDFIQDVYVHALGKRDLFKGLSAFSTWLYALARNVGLEILRKQKRLAEVSAESASEAIALDTELSDSLSENELIEAIQEELEQLPDVYRIPLILRYYEKMSYTDLSNKLGEKEATLRSHVLRGKKMITQRLKKRGLA